MAGYCSDPTKNAQYQGLAPAAKIAFYDGGSSTGGLSFPSNLNTKLFPPAYKVRLSPFNNFIETYGEHGKCTDAACECTHVMCFCLCILSVCCRPVPGPSVIRGVPPPTPTLTWYAYIVDTMPHIPFISKVLSFHLD